MGMMELRRGLMAMAGSGVQIKTGTFTGAGSATVEIQCPFEPTGIIIDSDLDSTTAWGVGVAREVFIAHKNGIVWRHNSTTATGYSTAIANYDTLSTPFGWDVTGSGMPKAKYENGIVTLSNVTNASWAYFISGQTYTYVFYQIPEGA